MSSHIKMNRRLVQHILFLGAVFMASLAGESFWYRAGPFFQINKHRPIFFSGSNKLDDLFLWFLSDIFMCVAVASSVADIMHRYLICYIFVVGGVTGVSSIRVSHLIVPAQVGRGHDAQLHCHFNLGGNILYSVKWFKGIEHLALTYWYIWSDLILSFHFFHFAEVIAMRSTVSPRCDTTRRAHFDFQYLISIFHFDHLDFCLPQRHLLYIAR